MTRDVLLSSVWDLFIDNPVAWTVLIFLFFMHSYFLKDRSKL